jgi:copper(I)-binding protein
MNLRKFVGPMALLFTMSMSWQSQSAETKAGSLVIQDPRARATAPGAEVGAGYLSIMNMGDQNDWVIGIDATFAGHSEIHEMKMEGDIARMRPLESGLEVPAGQQVDLNPGGLHIMFMRLQQQLQEGELYPAVLHFKLQGSVNVMFEVQTNPSGIHSSKHQTHDADSHDPQESEHRSKPY